MVSPTNSSIIADGNASTNTADNDKFRQGASSHSIRRIDKRLDNAVNVVAMSPSFVTTNRSPDLIPLTANYVQMKNRLRALLGVLITYQKLTRDLQESRFEIAEQLALLSEGTPIEEEIGCEVDGAATEKLQLLSQQFPSTPMPCFSPTSTLSTSASTPSSSSSSSTSASASTSSQPSPKSSFFESIGLSKESLPHMMKQFSFDYKRRTDTVVLSLHSLLSFGSTQAIVNDSEYQRNVVDYTTEWIDTVTTRVEMGLKNVRKLASDRLHYERKIETLRNKATGLERKGKTSPASAIERLSRNEAKLKEAFTIHEKKATKVCALIEAVTQEGYKDLFTLVRNYIQWERNRIGRENDISSQLGATLNSLNAKMENHIEIEWNER